MVQPVKVALFCVYDCFLLNLWIYYIMLILFCIRSRIILLDSQNKRSDNKKVEIDNGQLAVNDFARSTWTILFREHTATYPYEVDGGDSRLS